MLGFGVYLWFLNLELKFGLNRARMVELLTTSLCRVSLGADVFFLKDDKEFMNLDVKNLAFGAVGETEFFDLNVSELLLDEGIIAHDLKGKIDLIRLDNSILANIKLRVSLNLICDRCLDNFNLVLPIEFKVEYFLGGSSEDEDAILISRDFKINLTEPIREEIILAIPTQRICKESCLGICSHCGANLGRKKCKCGKYQK